VQAKNASCVIWHTLYAEAKDFALKRQDASTGEIVEVKTTAPASKTPKQSEFLQVKVYSPFKVYFNDRALSISAENDTGPFDILPKHHNFMSLLNACDLIVRLRARDGKDKEQKIRISRGIMHVRQDQVTVFLDV